MAAKQEGRNGLYYGWALGESGWNGENDANLQIIGRRLQLSAKDRDLTVAPGSPSHGDTYIVATPATGVWAGQENSVAIWDADAAAWAFEPPSVGWLCYIEDEEVLSVYKVAGWSAGVAI